MSSGSPVPAASRLSRAWLLSIALLAITAVYLVVVGAELVRQAQDWRILHQERDFPWYYLAAHRLLHGQDFYSGLRLDARALGINNYFIDVAVSPPTFPLAVAWLPLFPYPVAWGLWQVLSLAALAFSLLLIVRELRLALSAPGWITLSCLALLFPPFTFHMIYAHTELFMLLLLAGAWVCLRRGKEVPGGVLIGLAGAIRLYPLLLLLCLVQRRAWKALLAAMGSGLGLAGLAALMAGPSSYVRYLDVSRQVVPTFYARAGNLSLWGSVYKLASIWPPPGPPRRLWDGLAIACSLGIVGLTLWFTRRKNPSLLQADRGYGLFIIAALLASPLSWVYYQVLLYLPLLAWVAIFRQKGRPLALWAILGALVASLTPYLGAVPNMPPMLQHLLAFVPTCTLAGTYLGLLLLPPPAEPGPSPLEGTRSTPANHARERF